MSLPLLGKGRLCSVILNAFPSPGSEKKPIGQGRSRYANRSRTAPPAVFHGSLPGPESKTATQLGRPFCLL